MATPRAKLCTFILYHVRLVGNAARPLSHSAVQQADYSNTKNVNHDKWEQILVMIAHVAFNA